MLGGQSGRKGVLEMGSMLVVSYDLAHILHELTEERWCVGVGEVCVFARGWGKVSNHGATVIVKYKITHCAASLQSYYTWCKNIGQ